MQYQIRYQLGAYGTRHRKLGAACKALKRAVNAARASGDCQAIRIEHADGTPLTVAEDSAVWAEVGQ